MIWLVQLVFDCTDPDAVMQFWGQALEIAAPDRTSTRERVLRLGAEQLPDGTLADVEGNEFCLSGW